MGADGDLCGQPPLNPLDSWRIRRENADLHAEVERLRLALTTIAQQDWRGHKPHCITVAEAALHASSVALDPAPSEPPR